MSDNTDLTRPELYLNRELSWLDFDARVLEEAQDASLSLHERLKFLGIFSTNLDEFFMVRVAGLKQQLAGGVREAPADGMLPAEQLQAIARRAHELVAEQYGLWRSELLPELAERSIRILTPSELSREQADYCRVRFLHDIFPALTPLAVDSGHPFPQLKNQSLNIGVRLQPEQHRRRRRRAQDGLLAVVQVPRVFSRLVLLPAERPAHYVLIDALIGMHVGELFPGYQILEAAMFRVTRNWDLNIDEDDSDDLLLSVEEELLHRERGAAVRLELEADASTTLEGLLTESLRLEGADVYRVQGPLQINDLAELTQADRRPEPKAQPGGAAVPLLAGGGSMFDRIRDHDLMLHHPYESFEPVVRFLDEAADDPDVLAIKQTLYRTGVDLPIMRALCRAASNGKQVAALVEIKARFDEERNIAWGRRMEDAGVHVMYGLVGLKTHCKAALVVRREGNGVRRYVHLGTGNYNLATARQYTDVSLFTANADIAEDTSALFNLLTGYSSAPTWRKLAVAPFTLHTALLGAIEQETERARRREPARIRAKMNALVDPESIRALYRASQAGVEIDLAVRGTCCLRPGLAGISDRIRVTSVVDRYLEHSRVFAFGPDERVAVYVSSADWMPRNFFRRVEVMVPVEDPRLRERLLDEVLGLTLRDTAKARWLQPDGSRIRPPAEAEPIHSQVAALEAARRARSEADAALRLGATSLSKTGRQPSDP